MKKQYVFIFLIGVTLYILYLILSHKYREYEINSKIELIRTLNKEIEGKIDDAQSTIDYKTTAAYRNKILKTEQWLKDKGEKVVYMTTEQSFKKFTTTNIEDTAKKAEQKYSTLQQQWDAQSMTNLEKWNYLLFQRQKNNVFEGTGGNSN